MNNEFLELRLNEVTLEALTNKLLTNADFTLSGGTLANVGINYLLKKTVNNSKTFIDTEVTEVRSKLKNLDKIDLEAEYNIIATVPKNLVMLFYLSKFESEDIFIDQNRFNLRLKDSIYSIIFNYLDN